MGPLKLFFLSLFATKPLAAEGEAHGSGLKRSLGAQDLLFMGVGAIVGTGVFVLTGPTAATNAGPAVALSFAIAGLAAGLAGLCYAEMASMIPLAGSAYTYAYATVGECLAFVIGWNLILEYGVAAAMVSVGWSSYAVGFLGRSLGVSVPAQFCQAPLVFDELTGGVRLSGAILNVPAVLVLLSITALLCRGTQLSMRLMTRMVVVKLAVIVVFVLAASPFIEVAHWTPFVPPNTGQFGQFGVSGIFQAATILFFSYCGFDSVSTAAQECKNPQRDVPLAMVGSIAAAVALYVAVALVLTGVMHYSELNAIDAMALVLSHVHRGWMAGIVEAGALVGLSTVLLAQLFGQSRILYAMASDRLLPAPLLRLHPTFATPTRLTVGVGVLAAVAGGLFPIKVLGELSSVGTLMAFIIVSFGVVLLRFRSPAAARPFKVPGGPIVVPLLSASLSGLLLATATGQSRRRLLIWMAVGLTIYLFYGRSRSRLRPPS